MNSLKLMFLNLNSEVQKQEATNLLKISLLYTDKDLNLTLDAITFYHTIALGVLSFMSAILLVHKLDVERQNLISVLIVY